MKRFLSGARQVTEPGGSGAHPEQYPRTIGVFNERRRVMFRRFLFPSLGALALVVALGAPGQVHAQRMMRMGSTNQVMPGFLSWMMPGFRSGMMPGFRSGMMPGFRSGMMPGFRGGFDRRFDRFEDR